MRVVALIKRISMQMLRDKRTLALLLVAPLLVLTLMYFIFNGNTSYPNLGVVNVDGNIVASLESLDINVINYEEVTNDIIVDDKLHGILEMDGENFKLTLENSDVGMSKTLQMKVNQAIGEQIKKAELATLKVNFNVPTVATTYIYGNGDTSIFDILNPILVGFFVFFFVFLISGIGLLRERTTGTLEKLMSTPIRRWEVITGYLVGYGIFAVIQTVVIVVYSINILDIVIVGSIWTVLLINLLLALVALSLGILLSTFAASEFQMIQFIPLVVVPQIFFSGIFPIDNMASGLQSIGKIMPLYYGANSLKDVMYKGLGFSDIKGNLLILTIFALVFIVLNIFALKKYRKL
ncbi:MAG: ABC transporter permease [Clostridium sp.]